MIIDLNGYVEKFGNKSFDEAPFNNVDALVLAELSYVNFSSLAPSINKPNSRPFYLRNIPLFELSKLAKDEFTTNKNIVLLTNIKGSLRFRNIGICYVDEACCLKTEKQFYAFTLILPNKIRYISFRGTDLTLVGWKEDCNMSFLKETPAQECALHYVKKVTSLFDEKFYIGGHSKGGNLSFYSSLNIDKTLADRLIYAYSFDGPGFYDDELYKTDHYKEIHEKLIKIVPRDSLVGIVLNHTRNALVVDSNSLSVLQHNPYNWKIDSKTGDFVYLKRRADQSYVNEKALSNWLGSLSNEERMMATNTIFELLGGTSYSLKHLVTNFSQSVNNFFKVSKSYTKEEKEKLYDILKRLFYYFNNARRYYYKQKIRKTIKNLENEVVISKKKEK